MLFIFLNCRKLKHMKSFIFLTALSFCFIQLNAQDPAVIVKKLDAEKSKYFQMAETIWKWAEPGYLESKTTALLQENLKKEGFSIETGIADIPTAFVATYGSGKPVIGILAEMDALPGLSQQPTPERNALEENGYGHGCGHNLFGAGSLAAAVAVKNWMEANKIKGTVKLYGTPAEEGAGGGKTYLVRAGVFNDVDAVLHWHPGDNNNASPSSTLAYKVANFRFKGIAAHAAAAPDKGRSALDGVEAMNFMVNLMREHVSQETRIHYVIKKGGVTSNIVPDFAEVEFTIRHPSVAGLNDIWDRLVKTSEAAAMGTGTTVSHEVMTGLYNTLPNETLAKLMQKNLEKVGGVQYTNEETVFAEQIRKTVASTTMPTIASAGEVKPYALNGLTSASTDVGDVSWVVPTAGLSTATWVPGIPAHSWQAVACDGMSIGFKGMMVAAKTIALTAADLFLKPQVIEPATVELKKARGGDGFIYKSLAGDRKPPLDYRK
ncbi:MAG: amidohydrolase [Chitinophagaceae bacterium]|jgi:aminobenzoyl-glutamate utilization protein B|nr:amidohydrolase [Chitinophagaceae bacterium]